MSTFTRCSLNAALPVPDERGTRVSRGTARGSPEGRWGAQGPWGAVHRRACRRRQARQRATLRQAVHPAAKSPPEQQARRDGQLRRALGAVGAASGRALSPHTPQRSARAPGTAAGQSPARRPSDRTRAVPSARSWRVTSGREPSWRQAWDPGTSEDLGGVTRHPRGTALLGRVHACTEPAAPGPRAGLSGSREPRWL